MTESTRKEMEILLKCLSVFENTAAGKTAGDLAAVLAEELRAESAAVEGAGR